ncbi:MAG TPA: hypothetical protein VHR66_13440 [Gemmataceae bacterium]|jgi:hypothetical protein|nr:hypothetical protein [Gemmataceae bacterium]
MADSAIDRESEPSGRPNQADLRADYDDHFGRVRTPRQILRRRLLIPAIDFILLGICGIQASCFGALAATGELFDGFEGKANDLALSLGMAIVFYPLCGIGVGLSLLILIGGVGMLHLQHHRVALIAAYIVTGLSLASVFALPFFPFGIWALILLNKTEVRQEFARPSDPTEFVRVRRRREFPRVPPLGLLLIGGTGFACTFAAFVVILWDYFTDGQWQDAEFIWSVALAVIGMAVFTGLFLRGFIRRRLARNADLAASHTPSPFDHRDPEGDHA